MTDKRVATSASWLRSTERYVMKLRRGYWVAGALILVAGLASAGVWLIKDRAYDETDLGARPDECSVDVAADLRLMWQTANRASTPEAIHAAERVFATIDLTGLTRKEVIARLGDPRKSSDSRYNFPFYDAGPGDLVYRFDTGTGGCQYNIRFGWDGKVRRVQYLAID